MAVQYSTQRETNLSTSSTNNILVSLLNGTSLQHAMGTDKQMEQKGQYVKKLDAKANLQKVYNKQIQTPHELFN
jgi:hypothetical protein